MKTPLRTRFALLLAILSLTLSSPGFAGGPLETIDITGLEPVPGLPGFIVARVIGIRWDERAIPVPYRVNSTLAPVPNALGPAFLSLADATVTFQESFERWNRIRTSFIEMNVVGTVANPGRIGFDQVNELSFRTASGFGAIASSPSTTFIIDVELLDGDDIDGDGDGDVSAAILRASDFDGDGDTEFPAGSYKAGTILDNDVQFNTKASNGFRFTVEEAQADTVTRSVDLMGVAMHEFGHSFGLSHVLNNQKSDRDGTGATMFPFIDTGDPASELALRTLDSDEMAWASYFYPEGTAKKGPAALQRGDVPFKHRYGVISGEARHGVLDQPLAGASLHAVVDDDDRHRGQHDADDEGHQKVVASGFSGTTRLAASLATGGLFLVSPAFNIVDGRYSIPVPAGDYRVGIEPVDGQPVSAGSISFTAQIGAIFGQQAFNEEFYGSREGDVERRPGFGRRVHVRAGHTRGGIDIVTNRTVNINNFGTRDFVGFTGATPGQYYAVRVPAVQFSAANPPGGLVHGALFDTFVLDASVVPRFAEATFTTGELAPDGTATLDLDDPLASEWRFVGQDNDFAPWFFENPGELGRRIQRRIDRGKITDLFLVLRLPQTTPFPGVSAIPPLIGLDGRPGLTPPNDVPIFGLSYLSADGASFTRVTTFNFRFSLVLSEPPTP